MDALRSIISLNARHHLARSAASFITVFSAQVRKKSSKRRRNLVQNHKKIKMKKILILRN